MIRPMDTDTTTGARTSGRHLRRLAGGLLALTLFVGVAGCGSSGSDGAAKGDTATDVQDEVTDGDSAEVDESDLEIDEPDLPDDSGTALPEGWPTDILPVPDGFRVTKTFDAENGPSSMQGVAIWANGPGAPAELEAHFQEIFEENGLEVGPSGLGPAGDGGVTGEDGDTHYAVEITDLGDGEVSLDMSFRDK